MITKEVQPWQSCTHTDTLRISVQMQPSSWNGQLCDPRPTNCGLTQSVIGRTPLLWSLLLNGFASKVCLLRSNALKKALYYFLCTHFTFSSVSFSDLTPASLFNSVQPLIVLTFCSSFTLHIRLIHSFRHVLFIHALHMSKPLLNLTRNYITHLFFYIISAPHYFTPHSIRVRNFLK